MRGDDTFTEGLFTLKKLQAFVSSPLFYPSIKPM
jgi:hypothetical protein